MKKRSLTTRNLLDKKPGKPVMLSDETLKAAIGENAELRGSWLIYGNEKNGKTWFSLILARAIAAHHKVAYISAEEGLEGSFLSAVRRAGITASDRIQWHEYLTKDEIIETYRKPRTAEVIFIDNLTRYIGEIAPSDILTIQQRLPSKLIVYVAHEENKHPIPAAGIRALTFARVVFRIAGLRALITSRYEGGGGEMILDIEGSSLYWGEKIITN
ncbi:MAG: hypothetical protein LBU62_09685 [Bacteroidales bacterium]|jgi:predicted ATP-dependent serine protease|nr:hypothetical protein [Bacteroidales bacterium]